jgi:16S rRNA (guanine527-N7)-methyltransferase
MRFRPVPWRLCRICFTHCAPFAEDNPKTEMWFHKGLDYLDEVRSARDLWAFDLVEHKSQLQDGSVILKISNLSKPI